jgi:hypothetical protein
MSPADLLLFLIPPTPRIVPLGLRGLMPKRHSHGHSLASIGLLSLGRKAIT